MATKAIVHRSQPFAGKAEAIKGWATYLKYRELQRSHLHTYYRYSGGTATGRKAVEKSDAYGAAADSYEPWLAMWIES